MGNYSKYFDDPIEKVFWGLALLIITGIISGVLSGYILNRIEEKRLKNHIEK